MPNITLSAKDSEGTLRHMSLKTFKGIMEILEKNNDTRIILQAPVPDEHPQLQDIMDHLLSRMNHASIYLGAMPRNNLRLEHFFAIYDASTLLQGNPPVRPEVASLPDKTAFFIALPNTNYTINPALDFISSFENMTSVTLGVGWNSWDSGPSRIPHDAYGDWADKLIETVSIISKHGIETRLECGVMLCMFTEIQLGRLARFNIKWPIASCSAQNFIDIDGNMSYCALLQDRCKINLFEDNAVERANELFSSQQTISTGICMEAPSMTCRSLKARACGGGCYAHTADDWSGPGAGSQ